MYLLLITLSMTYRQMNICTTMHKSSHRHLHIVNKLHPCSSIQSKATQSLSNFTSYPLPGQKSTPDHYCFGYNKHIPLPNGV